MDVPLLVRLQWQAAAGSQSSRPGSTLMDTQEKTKPTYT